MFYHNTESICTYTGSEPDFLDIEIAASKSGKAKTLGLDNLSNISQTMRF